MRIKVNHVHLQCLVGDIAQQDEVDAVVNAANAELQPGGGVAGALHQKAGPELAEACAPMAPIRPGEAVVSGGFGLPNEYVIHCLGPIYGRDEPAAELLGQCYERALEIAEAREMASIAFPAISTGAFGYPIEPAAEVACNNVVRLAPELRHVRLIRFVLFSQAAYEVFCSQLVKAAAAVQPNVSISMSH